MMKKSFVLLLSIIVSTLSLPIWANDSILPTPDVTPELPVVLPKPPGVNARAYLLIDVDSGKIIAKKNHEAKHPPASLTKMMTLYMVAKALAENRIHIDTKLKVSKKAWKSTGSSMFLKEGQYVTIADLIKGIVVQSGNDASIAVAEYLSGTEEQFAEDMNTVAKKLGMNDTHFSNATGYPAPNLHSTALDLAILSRALIKHFPEHYQWYKEKSFTFNKIKQNNRNKLLWRDASVDGIKTGVSEAAGYTLSVSAKRGDMRLLAIILGAPSDSARISAGQNLLDYGFKYYKTHTLYKAMDTITSNRVWKARNKNVKVGVLEPIVVTIPKHQYKDLEAKVSLSDEVIAPVAARQVLGKLSIYFENELLLEQPLVALEDNPEGGYFGQLFDTAALKVHQIFN